jgi:hypothetical protein
VERVAEDDLRADLVQLARRIALTVPYVPTGMKIGVSTTPWLSDAAAARVAVGGQQFEFEPVCRRSCTSALACVSWDEPSVIA